MVFLFLATPAMAVETLDVEITIQAIVEFTVNNAGALTFTYDEYADFGVANDIGDVDYDLYVNQAWQVTGKILDGVQNAQTADDWDVAAWTLSVNAVTINETTAVNVDSGGAAVARTGSVWEVLLTIPWPESASTPDCTIEMTASSV
ncbi:hypothetical protein KAU08_05965 [bacterium]|nr:hypothetical protein [bacterium]